MYSKIKIKNTKKHLKKDKNHYLKTNKTTKTDVRHLVPEKSTKLKITNQASFIALPSFNINPTLQTCGSSEKLLKMLGLKQTRTD